MSVLPVGKLVGYALGYGTVIAQMFMLRTGFRLARRSKARGRAPRGFRFMPGIEDSHCRQILRMAVLLAGGSMVQHGRKVNSNLTADRRRIRKAVLSGEFYHPTYELQKCRCIRGYV